MKILLFFLSFLQTLIGIVFINMIAPFAGEAYFSFGLFVFLLIIAILLSLLVVFKIRKYEVVLPAIVEVILTPLAFPRYLIGLIISLSTGNEFLVEYDENELLGNIVGYTLYIEISESMSVSKLGNFISMTLFAFPVSFIMSYSFWNDVFLCDYMFEHFGMTLPRYNIILGILLIMFFAGALCVIRQQSVEFTSYNANYKYENSYTGQTKKVYSNQHLKLSESSEDVGWRQISGGYESHFTIEMIATLIFSPILVFTYFIGLIASILAFFVPCVCSTIGKIDYDELPLGSLQKVLHFFCGFVIIPGSNKVTDRDLIRSFKRGIRRSAGGNKLFQKSYNSYGKSKKGKKQSFSKVLSSVGNTIAYPFVKLWKFIKRIWRKMSKNCNSGWETFLVILSVIFFPFVLIYKGIKALIEWIIDNTDSVKDVLIVILKIIFFPFVLIWKLIVAIKESNFSQESLATVGLAVLAVLITGAYFIMGRTGFITKLAFDTSTDWLPEFFARFGLTKFIATLFEGAGIFCIPLAIIIAIVAIIEFVLLILAFILSIILMLLAVLLQIIYIIIIPIAIVFVMIFILLKNAADNDPFSNIITIILIIGSCILTVLYCIDLYGLMFPA